MDKTYDDYLQEQDFNIYFVFGISFTTRKEALTYAKSELSRQGILVEVMCLAVPDCACQNCGEMLFDWQSIVGESSGTSASDSCYYSLADGLVCENCAQHEVELEVHETMKRGSEIAAQETMCHLI